MRGWAVAEAALSLHVALVRVVVGSLRALGLARGTSGEGVSHGSSGAGARHSTVESMREVVGRSNRCAHLRHRILGEARSDARSPRLRKVDRRRKGRRREAGGIGRGVRGSRGSTRGCRSVGLQVMSR